MAHKIGILGAGGWGTTLALHCVRRGHAVTLWEVFPKYADELRTRRENIRYLPGFPLPTSLAITSSLADVCDHSHLLILAVPSVHLRRILRRFRRRYAGAPVLIATKGLEIATGNTMSAVFDVEIPGAARAVLSGPNIAREIAAGFPAAAVAASSRPRTALLFQEALSDAILRIYSSADEDGVQLGGALKNIYAIGAGVIDGLGLGSNTKASYLTRALREMTTLGARWGGKERTFSGLSGMGDLITTSFSPSSRNRSFGEALAKGTADTFLHTAMAIEGIPATRSVCRRVRREKIEAPIARTVERIVFSRSDPRDELRLLMHRTLKRE